MAKHDKRLCGGKKKQSPGLCTRPAGWGTDHPGFGKCKLHGGCAPSSRIAAVEEQAKRSLAALNVPSIDNPLTELARIAGQVVAWKDQMADRVSNLDSLRYSTEYGEQLRAEVLLWERALDRCEKFLSTMAKLNIDERLAQIEEKQADLIVFAVKAALEELGLGEDQQHEAIRHVARHLRAV